MPSTMRVKKWLRMLALALWVLNLGACARPTPPETWQVSIIIHDWLHVAGGADLVHHVDIAQSLGSQVRLPGFRFSITDLGGSRREVHLRCVPPGIAADIDNSSIKVEDEIRILDVRQIIDHDQAISASTARIELSIARNP